MNNYKNRIVKGVLRTDGCRIVNEDGQEIILTGFATGNWQNPEGFMIGAPKMKSHADIFSPEEKNPSRFDRRRSVTQVVRELCGSEYLSTFWDRWEENHLGEDDLYAMAKAGFNCVRLVLNANSLLYEEPGITFNEKSFKRLDQIFDWCEKYRIYAILDMHGAVGGVCGCCGDSLHFDYPSLFGDDESWERCLILWEELARRYGERWILAGYDLLNEPVSTPPAYYAIPDLEKFYMEAIARIRKIDQKHIFFLEGPNFARGNQIFKHDYDPGYHNWCIHIHIYNASPEIKDLYPYLLKGQEFNVPVWIGECGSTPIHNGIFFDICAQLGIGYSIWCWKIAIEKPEDIRAVGYHLPQDWELVRSFCSGGARPSYAKSQAIFEEYLENLKFSNCVHHTEYARISAKEPSLAVPGTGYDMFLEDGSRYFGSWLWSNYLNFRIEDHTKLIWATTKETPVPSFDFYPHEVEHYDPLADLMLELGEGEFANYTIHNIIKPCAVNIEASSPAGATVKICCNGIEKGIVTVPVSDVFHCVETNKIDIPVCEDVTVKLVVTDGILQIKNVKFAY